MAEKKPTPKTEALKKALANRQPKPPAAKKAPVAAAATRPKAENPRSAKARDARRERRGRLPQGTQVWAEWDGKEYVGKLYAVGPAPKNAIYATGGTVLGVVYPAAQIEYLPTPVKEFIHKADGLFRLMEELDVMFWNWLAAPGDEEIKARLVFAPRPPAPEPWPSPEAGAGTGAAAPIG